MVEFAALVCADVQDRQAQGDAVDVTTQDGAWDAIVLGDRLALRRVLANIIDNAIKYGGVAHVRMGLTQQAIIVSVDDEGPGIPEELRKKIFQPFFTTKDVGQGTGLGLSVSKGLVESHGGVLTLADEVRPTRFVLTLPSH